MQRRHNNILLLTATIQPMKDMPALARTDPYLRLQDYKTTLRAYLGLLDGDLIDRIVFAENSNADLSELRALTAEAGVGDRVEFVSFYGLDFDPAKGRGFGEFKLIDHAMCTAECLRDNADVVVWKCTGRYFVRNLEKLIRKTTAPFDVLCHCRDYPTRWCELYMLAWSVRGYEKLIRGVYVQLAETQLPDATTNAEALFRSLVDQASKTITVVPRFKVVPLIDGIRGWDNARYPARWLQPKILVRRAFALLLPSVWI